jgi:hypothetical protein
MLGSTKTMPQPLFDVMVQFVNRYHDEDDSTLTTSEWDFAEGTRKGKVQLMWWKEESALLIKEIHLTPNGLRPKNCVDASSRALMQDEKRVLKAVVKSIVIVKACEGITDKFVKLGWLYDAQTANLVLV